MGKYAKVTKKQMRKLLFISQNMRRIKSINRLEELFYVTSTRNILGIYLQDIFEIGHYRLITSGLSQNVLNGNRDLKVLQSFKSGGSYCM